VSDLLQNEPQPVKPVTPEDDEEEELEERVIGENVFWDGEIEIFYTDKQLDKLTLEVQNRREAGQTHVEERIIALEEELKAQATQRVQSETQLTKMIAELMGEVQQLKTMLSQK
jgi:hypothetical protein